MRILRITRSAEKTRRLFGGALIISRGASQPATALPKATESNEPPPTGGTRKVETTLIVLGALVLAGYGLGAGGLLGALTGGVAGIGVGSGLVIARGAPEAGLAPTGDSRRIRQRVGGLIAALACLGGVLLGAWRLGWLWGGVGYAVGIGATIVMVPGLFAGRPSANR